MNKRENLLRLLRRQGYDFIPVEFTLCDKLLEDYRRIEKSDQDYREYFGMDCCNAPALIPDDADREKFLQYYDEPLDGNTVIDEWGIGHRKTATMNQILSPLKKADSLKQIEEYPLPSYSAEKNKDLCEEVKKIHQKGLASVGNMPCTVWETSWYLRGMENLMMEMVAEEEMAERLLDRITQMSLERACLYAQAGVDLLYLGDDIGMQKTLLMSQELYRNYLKPRLTKIISAAKEIKPDIIVCYHSCGYVKPLIPDLIEAGIDVLNPVQPECMDFAEIYQEFGDVLSFSGTIGTQTVMPFGSPQDVRENVWNNLRIAGPKGGLWVGPTHQLESDVPWENILAYVDACRSFENER